MKNLGIYISILLDFIVGAIFIVKIANNAVIQLSDITLLLVLILFNQVGSQINNINNE